MKYFLLLLFIIILVSDLTLAASNTGTSRPTIPKKCIERPDGSIVCIQ